MAGVISNAVKKLTGVTDNNQIGWDEFDRVLDEIEDINAFDEKYEETILAEYLKSTNFYHGGSAMPEAIRRFLDHGYDVSANDGRNGGLALSSLCWSSYDRYVLDAAKVLLNAGAPVVYRSLEDDPDEEPEGVIGSIAWKLFGAWAVDKDYDWANILVAYDAMIKARMVGDDYNSIFCHLDCVGCKLESVEADKNAHFDAQGSIAKFSEKFVMWFDGKPLVVCPYTEFVINPVWVINNKDNLINVDSVFSEIIGATLVEIRYIESTFCYFEFDNGYRLLFASQDVGDQKRIGTFEIRKNQNDEELYVEDVEYIACIRGKSYAEHVVDYDEVAIVFFGKESATVLCPSPGEYGKHSICIIQCAKALVADYTRRLALPAPESVKSYYDEGMVTAMRVRCGDKYLYLKTSDYYEIEMKLSSVEYDLAENCLSLRSKPGERLVFAR